MNNFAPIILFTYNRPWHTEQVLQALKNNELADQCHLIIFVDGPKDNTTSEQIQKIEEVKQLVQKDTWCGTVEYHFAEKKFLQHQRLQFLREISALQENLQNDNFFYLCGLNNKLILSFLFLPQKNSLAYQLPFLTPNITIRLAISSIRPFSFGDLPSDVSCASFHAFSKSPE